MKTKQPTSTPTIESNQLPTNAKLALLVWLVGLLGGLAAVAAYASTPGTPPKAVANWPAGTTLTQGTDSPTLVMFLHPKCPCSWSTLREFERVLCSNNAQVELRIGLFCPPSEPDAWTETELSKFADQLQPGSTFVDRSAIEAQRFGALTSGHVLAFTPSGECVFSGGITVSRGHDGENRGSLALKRVCRGEELPFFENTVFGCLIIDSSTTENSQAGE